MQQPSGLSFSDVDGQLVVRCSLTPPRPTLSLASLRTVLEGSGFGAWVLSEAALTKLVERWNNEPGDFEHTVPRGKDASFSIEIDRDGLAAWVGMHPAQGGKPVQADALLQALAAAGVVHGIDTAGLQQACVADQPVRVRAATATPPVRGLDTRFELLVADTRDRAPKVDEQGHFDFHQLGDIPVVRAGQALMRRHASTAGTPGLNVRGDSIAAAAGKDIPFDAKLVGAAVDTDDAGLLRALVNGQPVRTDCGVMVEQIVRLKNVSMASGNISFDGTIEVDEDIQPGLTVKATGDVVVKGTVEGARIECGGNVQVGGGIIARSVVRAGHAVSARFAESSEIIAATVIAITDMAVHCTLEAHHQILIGSRAARRGRLVGGVARAMMLVQAPTLGASAGGVTRIQVGVNPDLDRRLKELVALAEHQKADEDKLGKAVKHLTQHGDPRGMLTQVQAAWKQVLAAWGETLDEKTRVEGQLALTAGARVDVLTGVDGDLDLQFGNILRRVRQNLRPGAFSITVDGKVIYTDEGGNVTAFG